MSTHPPLAGGSRLGLHPHMVKGNGDRFTVINPAGRQVITTGKAGIEAIGLLHEGRTLEEARRILGSRYGHPAAEVDLSPLLDTLFSSGFVRAVDGHAVAPRSTAGWPAVRLWVTMFVWSPLVELGFRVLPPGLALRLAHRWFQSTPAPEVAQAVAANLRSAPALNLSEGALARVAAGNARALRRQPGDRLLLASTPPRRLRRWLCSVPVSGLEHLLGARARGNGTILCSFHLGSYSLIPFVLAARGIPVTVYSAYGEDARRDVAAWVRDQGRRGEDYPMRIAGGRMGVRSLLRALGQGESVLIYADQPPGADSAGRGGRVKAPFLGTSVWAARGAGWLQMNSGAAVLPVVLPWEKGGHHLHIEPEVPVHHGRGEPGEMDGVVLAIHQRLERYVRECPDQWLKWRDFTGMLSG